MLRHMRHKIIDPLREIQKCCSGPNGEACSQVGPHLSKHKIKYIHDPILLRLFKVAMKNLFFMNNIQNPITI